MNNLILLLYPIINVIVTALFAAVVLRQYIQRHRQYQLFWSISLSMTVLATLAYVLMIVAQPTSSAGIAFFRIYYIFGASLVPAWLGLGSIALVTSPRVVRICLIVLSILSVLTIVLVAAASIDMHALSQVEGTAGGGILRPGAWLVMLILLNSLGTLAVAGVAIYSGIQLLRRQGSSNLLWGNIFILAGVLIIAFAGTNVRLLGGENTFWLIMAFGWIVFFAGVLFASRPHTRHVAAKPSEVQRQMANEGGHI